MTDRQVVVPLSRLPENIGRMLNMYLSGEVVSLHLIGATRDGRVINTSSEGMLDEVKRHDSLVHR